MALFWLTNPTRDVQNVLLAFGICLTRFTARVRMLAHDAVAQGQVLIGVLPHDLIESSLRQVDRPGSGDDPANVQRVPIPHLHAETHVADVVQVRVGTVPGGRSLIQPFEKCGRFLASERFPDLHFRHLLGHLGVQRVALLKFALAAG